MIKDFLFKSKKFLQEGVNIYDFQTHLLARLKRAFGCESFADLPCDQFENIKKVIEDHQSKKEVL